MNTGRPCRFCATRPRDCKLLEVCQSTLGNNLPRLRHCGAKVPADGRFRPSPKRGIGHIMPTCFCARAQLDSNALQMGGRQPEEKIMAQKRIVLLGPLADSRVFRSFLA